MKDIARYGVNAPVSGWWMPRIFVAVHEINPDDQDQLRMLAAQYGWKAVEGKA